MGVKRWVRYAELTKYMAITNHPTPSLTPHQLKEPFLGVLARDLSGLFLLFSISGFWSSDLIDYTNGFSFEFP